MAAESAKGGNGGESIPSSPCIMVVFGASGDLTKRKLLPALYNLAAQKLLPDRICRGGVWTKDVR